MKIAEITQKLSKTVLIGILCVFALPHGSSALVLPGLCLPPTGVTPTGAYAHYGYRNVNSSVGFGDCVVDPVGAQIRQDNDIIEPPPEREAAANFSTLRVRATVGDGELQDDKGFIVESASTEAGIWRPYIVTGPGSNTTLTLNFTINGSLFVANEFAQSDISLTAYVLEYPTYEAGVEDSWGRTWSCEPDEPSGLKCELKDGEMLVDSVHIGPPEFLTYKFDAFRGNDKLELNLPVPVGVPFGLHFALWAGSTFVSNEVQRSSSEFFESLEFGYEPEGLDLFTFQNSDYSIHELEPIINIRKQEEGSDSRAFNSGMDVPFEIEVTNTGMVDLASVVVTDVLVPTCNNNIGDLAAGDSVTYTCTATNVTENITNEACVTGLSPQSQQVGDCDPSSVEIESVVAREVSIDIRPFFRRNLIYPNSRFNIWVAVLSDSEFDPSVVDISTVRFGPAGATSNRNINRLDVNEDGVKDLLLRFRIHQTGISCGDTEATLTGETTDGEPITGSDTIMTLGCKKS